MTDFEKLWGDLKGNFLITQKIFQYFESTFLKICQAVSLEKIILFYLVENMDLEENMTISLIQHMINQIMLLRDGKEANMQQLKTLMELLDFTKIYKQNFENEYLNLFSSYYKAEVLKISETFEIKGFLSFVQKRFDQEKEISDSLKLSKKCLGEIMKILEEAFILNNMKNMLEHGFVNLIETNDFENLSRIFNSFQRIGKLDALKLSFNDYIKKRGHELIFSKSEEIIEPIVNFRKAMLKIVQKSFEGSKKMKLTIDYAFQYFINLKTNAIAEITSKFIDDCLRKNKTSNNVDEETLKTKLDDVFEIFCDLTAKDIFAAFYTKRLMKRLLLNTVFSYDLESHLLNKLKIGNIFEFKKKEFFFWWLNFILTLFLRWNFFWG